ncbi:unnamed protein product [Plutella xylostella]|uniref:(diamondback moth) hypothetical protein n=1 Tax=Plutella xylostella TaxID=51655 RepID=A0A8S4GCV2_PLUXY|nr:unnamed protein product [Plutella xylostella]
MGVCGVPRGRGGGGGALLAAWGGAPRLSLLRAMARASRAAQPTARLRLLCLLGQCIITPNSDSLIKDYEALCAQVLGPNPGDVQTWGRSPHPSKLPLLAMRILPKYTKYFELEYELTPKES